MTVEIFKLLKGFLYVVELKSAHSIALKLRVSNDVQPTNTSSPKELTEFPIVTLVRPLQPTNA